MKPQNLTISLLGRHYNIALSEVSERTFSEFAWLCNGNLDPKELLKAYLSKCQECAEIKEALDSLCEKIEQY
ncbi:MAG: hypothetical protein ACTTJS_05885 [Wolinella sp.]